MTEKDIMGACANAFKNGWSKVKLYFMMGLPTETDEDLAGIASLALRIKISIMKFVGNMIVV